MVAVTAEGWGTTAGLVVEAPPIGLDQLDDLPDLHARAPGEVVGQRVVAGKPRAGDHVADGQRGPDWSLAEVAGGAG